MTGNVLDADANRDRNSEWKTKVTEYDCGVAGVEAKVVERREGNDSGRVLPRMETEKSYYGKGSQGRATIHAVQKCVDVPSHGTTVEGDLSKTREIA